MTKDDSSMFAFERSYEGDRRLLLDLKSVSDEMDRRGEMAVSRHGGEVLAEGRKYIESGRGLKMIQSLASSLEHNRYDGVNETVIEMARG